MENEKQKSIQNIERVHPLSRKLDKCYYCCIRTDVYFSSLIMSQEHSLTGDIIRKVCPAEAELLRDPTMKAKLKFRSFQRLLSDTCVLHKEYNI